MERLQPETAGGRFPVERTRRQGTSRPSELRRSRRREPEGPFLTDLFVSAFTAARSFERIDVEGRGSLDLDDPEGRRELVARYLKEVVS